jgi:hypothetical protein
LGLVLVFIDYAIVDDGQPKAQGQGRDDNNENDDNESEEKIEHVGLLSVSGMPGFRGHPTQLELAASFAA